MQIPMANKQQMPQLQNQSLQGSGGENAGLGMKALEQIPYVGTVFKVINGVKSLKDDPQGGLTKVIKDKVLPKGADSGIGKEIDTATQEFDR